MEQKIYNIIQYCFIAFKKKSNVICEKWMYYINLIHCTLHEFTYRFESIALLTCLQSLISCWVNIYNQKGYFSNFWLLKLLSQAHVSVSEGSDAGDMDRLEELPLCSCRMEAPQVDSTSQPVSRQCMATESINGVVSLKLIFVIQQNVSLNFTKYCLTLFCIL